MKLLPIVRKVSGNNRYPSSIVVETIAYAMVDDLFYTHLNQFRWTLSDKYPVRRVARKAIRLHCEIWELSGRVPVAQLDHQDNDLLNAQLHNLREATQTQNQFNRKLDRDSTSKLKGVSWHSQNQRWQSAITYCQRKFFLGYFDNPVEAAKRYDEEAVRLFGEFAKTNKSLGLV